jgi:serine protease Do
MEVKPGSVAEQRGLKAGDVILEVAGAEVNDASDVKDALKEAGKSRVLMLVRSGENQRFLALPLAKG